MFEFRPDGAVHRHSPRGTFQVPDGTYSKSGTTITATFNKMVYTITSLDSCAMVVESPNDDGTTELESMQRKWPKCGCPQ